jgi:glycosyltransferase involved in cell wall biosynthesis
MEIQEQDYKKQQPKVSICIPAYNQTQYLQILLASIEAQTFKDFEVIVSDDSSTEAVAEMAKSYSEKFPINYTRNKPALGSPENWNAAIKKASGQLIKIMHHDDFFSESNSLEKMVACLDYGNYDFVFANTTIQNVLSPQTQRVHTIKEFHKILKNPELTFFGNPIGAPSTLLCRQEIAKKIQYNKKLIWLVDVEYYYRLFKLSINASVINEPLIATHDAAEHQISKDCIDDYELQANEQLILFYQMQNRVSKLQSFFMQMLFLRTMFLQNNRNKIIGNEKLPLWLKIYNSIVDYSWLRSVLLLLVKTSNQFRPIFI